jgi:hypothetical protein
MVVEDSDIGEKYLQACYHSNAQINIWMRENANEIGWELCNLGFRNISVLDWT